MKLAGKVALVTGASAGIGRTTALALAREGADVAVNYLTFGEEAERLAREIAGLGRRAMLLPVDVSDQAAVEAMVERTVRELGRLDILINDRLIARGEAVVVNDKFGVRLTDIVSPSERIARLR